MRDRPDDGLVDRSVPFMVLHPPTRFGVDRVRASGGVMRGYRLQDRGGCVLDADPRGRLRGAEAVRAGATERLLLGGGVLSAAARVLVADVAPMVPV